MKYKRLDYDWFTGVAFPRGSLSGYFIVWDHAYWRILPSRKMRSNIIFGENALLTLEVNFAEALPALEFLFEMRLRFPSIPYILSKSLWVRRNFPVSSFYIRCSNSLHSRLGDRAKITPAVRGRIRMRPSSSTVPTPIKSYSLLLKFLLAVVNRVCTAPGLRALQGPSFGHLGNFPRIVWIL